MSSELSRTELSCLITHKKGFAFKSKDYIPSGVPVVRVSNFTWDSISTDDLRYVSHEVASSTKVVQLNEYDVIVATVGSWPQNPDSIVGKVVRVPCPLSGALLNQNTVRLRVNDDNLVNQKYLYIALKTKEFSDHLISKAQGSANQASITLSDIFSYAIPWGTYTQRKYIVNVIDSINDKIVIANQINQTLEQMAQALFKSWFVDFEPVKAKMAVLEAGGSQADATLAAMTAISGKDADALAVFEREHPEQYAELKATAELFPSAMQDSELGEIPEGWYQTLLSEFTGFLNGYAFKSKDWRKTGFPVVKIGSVKPGFVDLKNCSYIDGIGIKNLERFEVFSGDILVGMTGYPGETGIIPETMQRVYLNQRVGKFTPLFEFLYSYVYTLVRNNNFKIYVSGQAHGSAQANISSNDILQYPVVKPNDALLRAFDVVVRNLISLKLKNQAQIQSLEQLRDTLLPKLLSGEITLPEAEQAVSEAENV
ncbi:TPA: restriction endonuclease subunit S [Escherichia coli]|uniref:restriction endonuclease subunit S n=1 Tax=Escherichia coli TaxID=562 RepID=UPI00135D097B|nr:restriction endonuclease subunit S [Escherichia coli]EJE3099583.1 restriction endonuclease subunit S [Escherichia coli]MCC4170718.1 restriction endonuclease subunit S [Escherichia coli]MCF6559661.1 restriction endonuclease subunit S [Escherichia coli]MCX3691852.1 restriction endonuclease subunit S [Escherichia coli]MCX3700606.1 restriction endonuclease subunit S [Escherichia coli]